MQRPDDEAPAQDGPVSARTIERGIVPGGRLDLLLRQLRRPDRRLLLGIVSAAPGRRRARMERELSRRLERLGIRP